MSGRGRGKRKAGARHILFPQFRRAFPFVSLAPLVGALPGRGRRPNTNRGRAQHGPPWAAMAGSQCSYFTGVGTPQALKSSSQPNYAKNTSDGRDALCRRGVTQASYGDRGRRAGTPPTGRPGKDNWGRREGCDGRRRLAVWCGEEGPTLPRIVRWRHVFSTYFTGLAPLVRVVVVAASQRSRPRSSSRS